MPAYTANSWTVQPNLCIPQAHHLLLPCTRPCTTRYPSLSPLIPLLTPTSPPYTPHPHSAPTPHPPPPPQDPSESAELESTSASGSYSQDPGDLDSFSGNALEWALRKVDASLDEIEHNPPAYQKAIYDFTKSPAGVAAAKGVKTAANVTVTATVEAAKIAAPVGKWALAEGFKAAVGLVSYAKQQQQEQERKQKQLGKGKGK